MCTRWELFLPLQPGPGQLTRGCCLTRKALPGTPSSANLAKHPTQPLLSGKSWENSSNNSDVYDDLPFY